MAKQAVETYGFSERRACRLVRMQRSIYRYQVKLKDDSAVIEVLRRLAETHRRWGLDKMTAWLRTHGYRWNHKRVRRVYREMGLHLRIKPKKRLPSRFPLPLAEPEGPNISWSMDFMGDSLVSGRRFRTLNIIDDFNRECLAIEIDTSLPSARVIRVLDNLSARRGYPRQLRTDNGPEFLAERIGDWAEQHGVYWDYIEPGKPAQNGYIERFNRTYREDVLDAYLFYTLKEARTITAEWVPIYNEERPHAALDGLAPIQFALVTQHGSISNSHRHGV
jgi:putative transposase